jgi:hypothetical protein
MIAATLPGIAHLMTATTVGQFPAGEVQRVQPESMIDRTLAAEFKPKRP